MRARYTETKLVYVYTETKTLPTIYIIVGNKKNLCIFIQKQKQNKYKYTIFSPEKTMRAEQPEEKKKEKKERAFQPLWLEGFLFVVQNHAKRDCAQNIPKQNPCMSIPNKKRE